MNWHRLFGVTLTDFFTDTAYRVDLEKDLSLKQQLLDVVIIEEESGKTIQEPPDGLENLARHNLLTYKSLHQPLDGWALDELVGHYVNYRKQISPSVEALLPIEDFRLYAVSTRYPEKLTTEIVLAPVSEGVYEVQWGSRRIRLIVLSQIPKVERNAIWQLFSGIPERVRYGASHYRWRRLNSSTIVYKLYEQYQVENIAMPYTTEDFYRDFTKEHLYWLTPEERLAGLSPDDLLKRLSPDDLLKRLSPDDLLKRLSPDDRLKGLSAEEIEAYLKKLRKAPGPKRRHKSLAPRARRSAST
jgi:hypothetical protein